MMTVMCSIGQTEIGQIGAKIGAEEITNVSKAEISMKEISVKFGVPQSRMEYPSRFEEPSEGYNPYDSADPYYDSVDPNDVADLPTDPYSGFEKLKS